MKKAYRAKSVVISRKPTDEKHDQWSAFIGLFRENNPHLKGRAPFEVLEVEKTDKVRIWDLRNISYYLMGNDVVINNLEEVIITNEDGIVTVTGTQNLPKLD